jgi:hypothetical protein
MVYLGTNSVDGRHSWAGANRGVRQFSITQLLDRFPPPKRWHMSWQRSNKGYSRISYVRLGQHQTAASQTDSHSAARSCR